MQINIGIEFIYLEIHLELNAFQEFLDRLENGLKYLTDQEILRNSSFMRKLNDLTDIEIAENELTELINRVMPRFFRNPALVSLYAIYESAITGIASYLQQKDSIPLKLEDIKGHTFLDQAKKYFKHVLAVPICDNNSVWERLKILADLRHALAHCNGRLEAVNENRREKIKNWAKSGIGICIQHDDLLISESFLRETYLIVKDSLSELVKRVSLTSKGKGQDSGLSSIFQLS